MGYGEQFGGGWGVYDEVVFKQALLSVNTVFSDKVQFVLPVYDAALFKVHKDVETEKIVAQFKEVFVNWIPKSKLVIKEKEFFEE